MAQLLPNGRQQFLDANGNPLVGGLVYFYIPNTTTPKDTWQDAAKSALNTNPVVCDAKGQATIYGEGNYRQILQDATGNQIWDKTVAAPPSGPSTFVSDTDPGDEAQPYDWWFDTANNVVNQRNADNTDWVEISPLLGPLLALSNIVGSDVSTPLNVLYPDFTASGGYIQFAGGILICFTQIRLFTVSTVSISNTWTFPVQFVVDDHAPFVMLTALQGASGDATPSIQNRFNPATSGTTGTSTKLTLLSTNGNWGSSDFMDVQAIAIGFWK